MASEKLRFYWVTFLPFLPVFDGCQYGRPGTFFPHATRKVPEHTACGNENRRRGDRMAQARMPRITRRLGSVCQDTGRPRSDRADHGASRTMAQRYSAPAPVVEGASDQSAQDKGTNLCSRREPGAATALAPPPPFVPRALTPSFLKSGAHLIPSNRHRPEHPQIFFKIIP
jgi:hypothetical protein